MEPAKPATELAIDCKPPAPPPKKRNRRRIRPPLLTLAELDQRQNGVKVMNEMISAIEADLGGRDQLSVMEQGLVEGFAGALYITKNLNARLALGQQINFSEHAQSVTEMVRVATRLGPSRRQRDVTTTLAELIREDQLAEQRRLAEEHIRQSQSQNATVETAT